MIYPWNLELKFALETLFRTTLLRGTFCLPPSIPPRVFKTYNVFPTTNKTWHIVP